LETLFCLWRLWDTTFQVIGNNKLGRDLVVSFDCDENEILKAEVVQLYKTYQLDNKFNQLEVIFCNIPAHENIYIRKNDPVPNKIPRLGYASGPNSQFFITMNKLANKEYVLLNETDCVPYRKDWLEQLGKRVFWNEEFWMLGSSYKGISLVPSDTHSHINGNAIYAVGSHSFQEFIGLWEQGLEETVKHRKHMAYDVYLSSKDFSNLTLQDKQQNEMRGLRLQKSKFVYSNLIWNASSSEDIEINNGIKDEAFIQAKSEVCICHGRTFIPQSFELALEEIVSSSSRCNKQDLVNLQKFIKKLTEKKDVVINPKIRKIISSFERNNALPEMPNTRGINSFQSKNQGQKPFTDDNLIFLLGNPRSGTTMMQKLITTSASICTTGEPWIQLLLSGSSNSSLTTSRFNVDLMKGALKAVEEENNLPSLTNNLLREFSFKYYAELQNTISPTAKYFMDKTPRYSMICEEVINRHPDAKYILMTRNPFEIACSVISSWTKNVHSFLTSAALVADFEVGLVNLFKLKNNPPSNFLLTSYDLVTQDADKELRRIADFLGLEFSEFSLDYSKTTKKFRFGDDKQADRVSKVVKNKNSWRSAFNNKGEYLNLIKYLESLPKDVLNSMGYSVPEWIE